MKQSISNGRNGMCKGPEVVPLKEYGLRYLNVALRDLEQSEKEETGQPRLKFCLKSQRFEFPTSQLTLDCPRLGPAGALGRVWQWLKVMTSFWKPWHTGNVSCRTLRAGSR